MTAQDCNRLQSLQNSVLRLLLGVKFGLSTSELLDRTQSFSVHQMIAYHTLISVKKTLISNQPIYLAEKMHVLRHERELRNTGGSFVNVPKYKLDVSRAGFVYRGSRLFNSLPKELRDENNMKKFKKTCKGLGEANHPNQTKLSEVLPKNLQEEGYD